jgi:hypothetical protein
MGIRETKEYKEMTMARLGELTYTDPDSQEEALAFWQKMVDTGRAWEFEGFYGRAAHRMIEDGVIQPREVV